MVSKLTITSSSEIFSATPITIVSTKDITLAPPLLPFPLLEIFNLIL